MDEFRYEIIRDIAEDSHRMRNDVTVVPMKRDVMNIPSLESRPQVTWTEENATKSTTTAHFGQITLTVKKMAAINLQGGRRVRTLKKNAVNCWNTQNGIRSPYWTISSQALPVMV